MSELRVAATNTGGGVDAYRFVETVYFTSNGTFSKATYPWLRAIKVKCQGGGGGGGGSGTNTGAAGGGGGGAYAELFITDIVGLSSSVTVTRGSGGSGATAGENVGGNGGSSSFGSLLVCGGGLGGQPPTGTAILPYGGTVTTPGDFNLVGGEPAFRVPSGAAGGSLGGSSFLGFGASPRNTNAGAGNTAAGFGGGGGGGISAGTNIAGGAGTNGIVIIELYA
jgi:hypothetical protein